MRKFFHMMVDTALNNQIFIKNYDLKCFDYKSLLIAQPCIQDDVSMLKLFVEDESREEVDFLMGPLSWPIVSSRFLDLVSDLLGEDAQIMDPPLFSLSKKEKIANYHLINILRVVDCLDASRALIGEDLNNNNIVYEIYIDGGKVPIDANIFRVLGCVGDIVVSEEFLNRIKGKGLSGLVVSEIS